MLGLCFHQCPVRAGEVTLKDGTVLQGKVAPLQTLITGPAEASSGPITIYPILLVANDLQRYFVPARQVLGETRETELSPFETFTVPQQPRGRKGTITSVGSITSVTPFDSFGRRTLTLQAPSGNITVIQGVTKLTPQLMKLTSLTQAWETAIATSSVSPETIDAILRQLTKKENPDHRLAITRFYIQAEMFRQAQAELQAIRAEFPELAAKAEEVSVTLVQEQAKQLLRELRLRQAAGQHQLAFESITKFPTEKVGEAVLRDVRELHGQYEQMREKVDRIRFLLGELQAKLSKPEQVNAVAPIRTELARLLDFENMHRCDAFFNLANDDKNQSLAPDEKLALALSGWVLGSANAITDLDQALRFWQARFLVRGYLSSAPSALHERRDMVEKLVAIEGMTPERMQQMLSIIPPFVDTPGAQPEKLLTLPLTVPGLKGEHSYTVMLPTEYHADHKYPLIIALHSQGQNPEHELRFWCGSTDRPGQALRHGYIVIAPNYAPGRSNYDYSPNVHHIVLEALHDARRRFHIDSDRVFLSGHGMGGDAAFDLGFSHPDLFAGVIPFAGVSDRYCKFYWQNAKEVPWYVVGGELDRDTAARNARELTRMMQYGYDLVYTEFVGSGFDSFYAEIHRLFGWMARKQRGKAPKQIEARTLRECDTRFHWYQAQDLPATVTGIDWTNEKNRRITPLTLTARISPGNTLTVNARVGRSSIWLAPDMIDYEKRLSVQVNGRPRMNDFIKPSLEVQLEDFRRRSDRQLIYWATLEY